MEKTPKTPLINVENFIKEVKAASSDDYASGKPVRVLPIGKLLQAARKHIVATEQGYAESKSKTISILQAMIGFVEEYIEEADE